MNIYFLVEGKSTEITLYPKWLKYLIPELKKVRYHDQVQKNNYYLISGEGYPNILSDHLDNAIDKINETNNYDYLVLCVDADEQTVTQRQDDIINYIQESNINLGKTQLIIIVQNRCLETWLLGNRKIFSYQKNPTSLLQYSGYPLSDYKKYYDVSQFDPELMGNFDATRYNHAQFHEKYLKALFLANNTIYKKTKPGDAAKEFYLKEIIKRVETTNHLKTFESFLNFCKMIKNKIGSDLNIEKTIESVLTDPPQ